MTLSVGHCHYNFAVVIKVNKAMKKITKLKLCAWVLAALTIVMLASGIQLEINPAGLPLWVWLHIVFGIAFFAFIFWHLALNRSAVRMMCSKAKSKIPKKGTRWLSAFFLLTLISAVVATVHWCINPVHSTIGGIHGKIGFVFIVMVIVHTCRHSGFFGLKKQKRT